MSTTTYSSIRIETYKSGEGRKRYSYDGRTDEGLEKARAHANKKFAEGCKVTMYRLEKVVADDGTYEWVRTDIKEADGRKPATSTKPSSKAKTTKKSTRKSVPAVAACDNDVNKRLDSLEKNVADLAKAVNALITGLKK